MKKNGSALVYVLILMIPVMLISISLMEISNINFKIGNNVISSRQALYNAEAGLIYGLKKLEINSYNENFSQYNNEKYIIFDNRTSISNSQNYSETYISYFNNIFTITSSGYYRGFKKTKSIQINRNSP
jgi:Tfp pilus assembly protein PilX